MIKRNLSVWQPFIAICILLVLVLLPSTASGRKHSYGPAVLTTGTIIDRNDESTLVFDLVTPTAVVDSNGVASIAGLDVSITEAGAPALPHYSTYIAIPPQATFDVTVEEAAPAQLLSGYVQPVPTFNIKSAQDHTDFLAADAASSIAESAPLQLPNLQIYESNKFYPEQQFVISDEMLAGGLRLIKLDLYPLRYNAAGNTLRQSGHLTVRVQFAGATLAETELANDQAPAERFWRENVLNYPPASWRIQTPVEESAADLTLPVGNDTFKIEVDHDGLYAISGSELAASGMDLASVDTSKMQMMHRGKAVSYQFVNNDGKAGFGPNDEIRFYGWQFDGSRYEDMYINNNVFWLWANGSGKQVRTVKNEAGKGYSKVTKFDESITTWPHQDFFPGLSIDWDASPNDATAWHWKRLIVQAGKTRKFKLPLTLPDPATGTSEDGTILIEFTSRYSSLYNSPSSAAAEIALNGGANKTNETWKDGVNLNIEHKAPISQFLEPGEAGYPENTLNLAISGTTTDKNVAVYVTRVTVDYVRELNAVEDELIFGHEKAGNHEFHISGYSAAASDKVIVWDISNRYEPTQVDMQTNQRSANEASSTVIVGQSHKANARFIATGADNIQQVKNIDKFVPGNLNPPKKAGTWVAVSHKSLLPAATDLAQYRANQSGISTWVIDVEDIANQVGFGFNTPVAIRDYLRSALANWTEPPQYLTLFGDATENPRLLDCLEGCSQDWDKDKPTLVPTDLLFVDRFNGLIPVDYTYSLLVDLNPDDDVDDLLPDLAVGRITAETLKEANDAVQKIKTYETSFESIQPWHNNITFVADNPDSGGSFCVESMETAAHIPNSVNKDFLCLPDVPPGEEEEAATEALRAELFDKINNEGMAILNYRGHGGVRGWANSPHIMHIDFAAGWENVGRPLVLLSADCLDGHFASTATEGLGETIFDLGNNRGTSAHWSSSGLGFTFEHSVLINAFYDGVFKEDLPRIGDAVNYAKMVYLTKGYDTSEAYAFILLGDPAMNAYRWVPSSTVSLPVVLSP